MFFGAFEIVLSECPAVASLVFTLQMTLLDQGWGNVPVLGTSHTTDCT